MNAMKYKAIYFENLWNLQSQKFVNHQIAA